ncbi:MAG: peptidase U32 [Chloroflexi bacterium]|nr:peptidase U32 [Chloroflexota bacterium]
MKLLLAANYDLDLLPHLRQRQVSEIYGKLPADIVGGGRATYMATPLGRQRLAAYVATAHAHGLEFNYLLNAACLGNQEWTKPFQTRLNRLLEWLAEIGVDTLTISTPYLLQAVKRRYPQFRTRVGIYAQVDTVKRAQYWQDLGADGICLESFSINRDFEKLERIRQAVSCELSLIANHICQPNCALQVQHQNAFAHASGTRRGFMVDISVIQCNFRRLRDPSLMISAGWIRPEDLRHYEALGYHNFKLIERNIPSAALLRRAQAYAQRRFDGNLAELLFSWGFSQTPPRFSWAHFLHSFGPWHISPTKYRMVLEFLRLQGFFFPLERLPVTIDAAAIPADFLEQFRRVRCNDTDCRACGYCAGIAQEAVQVDPAFLEQVTPLYQRLEAALMGGELWHA